MSKKSPGSHVISPDEPVRGFSPDLESCFEQLHRLLCNQPAVPGSVGSISRFCEQMKALYYSMRELLEDDFGISQFVKESLPIPEIGHQLKLLHQWEESGQGEIEYESRLAGRSESPYPNSTDCWEQYRWHLFEAVRILEITKNRIDPAQPEKAGYRFPWLDQPHLHFDIR